MAPPSCRKICVEIMVEIQFLCKCRRFYVGSISDNVGHDISPMWEIILCSLCQVELLYHRPRSSPVLGAVWASPYSKSHLFMSCLVSPIRGISFPRVPLTSILIVCFTLFPSSIRRICPYHAVQPDFPRFQCDVLHRLSYCRGSSLMSHRSTPLFGLNGSSFSFLSFPRSLFLVHMLLLRTSLLA